MYDNKTKESARCWCWNQVCRRVPKGSTVMVLIGDTDFELQEGTKRGMKVVGVDKKLDNVKRFRKSKGVAIEDDFYTQMINLKPDAIIFDGVSGVTKNTLELLDSASLFTKAIVWNGLRGRDRLGKQSQLLLSDFVIDVHRKGRYVAKREAGIHRAMLAYAWFYNTDLRTLRSLPNILQDLEIANRDPAIKKHFSDILRDTENSGRDFAMRKHKPEFMSYRSKDSGQYFDTGAWSTIFSAIGKESGLAIGNTKQKRKSAAAKALMTMRN